MNLSLHKLRIRLRAYDPHLVDEACTQLISLAEETGTSTVGPVPLPTKRRIYCVLRSPHVNKDAREHLEIRTHVRLLDLVDPTPKTMDAIKRMALPAGVEPDVKVIPKKN